MMEKKIVASNPDPEICPLDGSYTLRGLISPPYSTSRHKRNHNSKLHNNHHHLHDDEKRLLYEHPYHCPQLLKLHYGSKVSSTS